MSTPTPSQQAAISRIGENIALRSGAGCGKTFVLARRFTELLLHSKCESPLRRFVALTFTEKAALEMSQRVRAMLEELAGQSTGDSRRKFLQWIDEIPQARISTIHSFCSALLRTHAIAAGLDPAFAVSSDELAMNQMLEEACEQAVLSAIETHRADVAAILANVSFDRLVEQVLVLADNRTNWRAEDFAGPQEVLRRWQAALAAQRRKAWDAMTADANLAAMARQLADGCARCSDADDTLLQICRQVADAAMTMLGDESARTPANFDLIAQSPGNLGGKAWGGRSAAKAVRDEIKALQAAFAPYAPLAGELNDLDRQSAATLCCLVDLAQQAVNLYTAAKRKKGLLDFTDLLHHAHRLLAEHEDVRRSVAGGIDQLLIDECQDTDAFQVGLLLKALFRDGGGDLTPGKLFVVGDAKQSIYRFRGAQLEVFQGLCRRLGQQGQIGLDVSFRTHPAGVAFVNQVFGPLMGSDYTPVQASRTLPSAQQRGPTVEILLAQPAEEGAEIEDAGSAVALQAAVTAQRIARMLDEKEGLVWDRESDTWRPVRPGDVAILFSRMTSSLEFERQLARRNIPYYVVAGTGFFKQQEIFDILLALQAIDDPHDDIAFFGTLRSSLLGLDDNALMHISRAIDRPYLPRLMLERRQIAGLSADQQQSLNFAVSMLADLHGIKDRIGCDELIRRLLQATGYEAVLLSQFQGRRMLGNVRMLLEQAQAAGASHLALADFIHQVRQRVLGESRYEQAAVESDAADVVRLMSIHKAKGLEFPVVILPDLNMAHGVKSGQLMMRSDWGLTCKLGLAAQEEAGDEPRCEAGADAAAMPLSYCVAALNEKRDSQQEEIRRLYVAMTRHEDHLVLIGANWRSIDGQLCRRDSFINMIDTVLGVSAALDKGHATIPYGSGLYHAAVAYARPENIAAAKRDTPPPGRHLLASVSSPQELASAIAAGAEGDISPQIIRLLSHLPAQCSRPELAITALNLFSQCPMRYRWQYELRLPLEAPCGSRGMLSPSCSHGEDSARVPWFAERSAAATQAPSPCSRTGLPRPPVADAVRKPPAEAGGWSSLATPSPHFRAGLLDAAQVGTLLHRCMEHLDFKQSVVDKVKLAARAKAVLTQQAMEMDLDAPDEIDELASDFAGMIAAMAAGPIWNDLARAKCIYRELDFTLELDSGSLRGQIDLLFQDADGNWHVLDYKSDRLHQGESPQAHAEAYQLQILLYAAAAKRALGALPKDATIYFLRSGQSSVLELNQAMVDSAVTRADTLVRELAASQAAQEAPCGSTGIVSQNAVVCEAQRSNHACASASWQRRPGRACNGCPYFLLCETGE